MGLPVSTQAVGIGISPLELLTLTEHDFNGTSLGRKESEEVKAHNR